MIHNFSNYLLLPGDFNRNDNFYSLFMIYFLSQMNTRVTLGVDSYIHVLEVLMIWNTSRALFIEPK